MRIARNTKYGEDERWKDLIARARRTKMSRVLRGFAQSTLSLSFNLGGMLAGTLFVLYLDVFSMAPWALLLFPGVLSIRGAIGGLFSGRLSTALHLGTVVPSYTKNTRRFRLLSNAIITLTLGSSVVMGLTTSLFSAIALGTGFADSLAILAVAIATMGLSIVLISPITLAVSILAFKRGLDPDVIVYPIISTVADVIVTVCYVLVLTGFFSAQPGQTFIGLLDLVFLSIACYVLAKNYREPEFVKTVKEFLLTLVLVAFIVNVTGFILGKIGYVIEGNTKIYVVYPAMIDTVGDVGSIVGSTATTKLALGTIERSLSSIKHHLVEICGAWSASLVMFTVYAAVSSSMDAFASPRLFWVFVLQLLATNVLAVSSITVISFAVAIYSLKRGWDPDNLVIPIESSLADVITTISLFMALILLA